MFLFLYLHNSNTSTNMKKKLTRKEKEALPCNENLKIRALEAKKKLPGYAVSSIYFHYFDEVKDTVKNRSKLSNVLQGRITDEEITENLEALVKIFEKKNQEKK